MTGTASAAAQVLIAIIPIVGIVMGSVVVFFSLLWSHRRKGLMIRQGLKPEIFFDLDSLSLLGGLLNLGVGLVLTVFFLVKDGWGYGLLGGLVPLSVGLSLSSFFFIRKKLSNRK